MNTPETPISTGNAPNASQNARALIKTLQQGFPVFRDYSPLAIGIDKQLLGRLPEIDRKTLRIALGMHTNSLRYLKTIEKATHRLDLDGNTGAELMPAHREHAAEVLRERFRKDAERRKALREAEALAQREQQLEQQRVQKLSQLVEKFGKNR